MAVGGDHLLPAAAQIAGLVACPQPTASVVAVIEVPLGARLDQLATTGAWNGPVCTIGSSRRRIALWAIPYFWEGYGRIGRRDEGFIAADHAPSRTPARFLRIGEETPGLGWTRLGLAKGDCARDPPEGLSLPPATSPCSPRLGAGLRLASATVEAGVGGVGDTIGSIPVAAGASFGHESRRGTVGAGSDRDSDGTSRRVRSRGKCGPDSSCRTVGSALLLNRRSRLTGRRSPGRRSPSDEPAAVHHAGCWFPHGGVALEQHDPRRGLLRPTEGDNSETSVMNPPLYSVASLRASPGYARRRPSPCSRPTRRSRHVAIREPCGAGI